MSETNNLTSQPHETVSLRKSVLIGAAIAACLISFFVFSVYETNPNWGKLWRIQPLIITPLAGAAGGAFFYFMFQMGMRGMNKTVAILLGMLGYVVALWLGTVLGLSGTLWN